MQRREGADLAGQQPGLEGVGGAHRGRRLGVRGGATPRSRHSRASSSAGRARSVRRSARQSRASSSARAASWRSAAGRARSGALGEHHPVALQHQQLGLALPAEVPRRAKIRSAAPGEAPGLLGLPLDERALGPGQLGLADVLVQPAGREQGGGPPEQPLRVGGQPGLPQHAGPVEQPDRVRRSVGERLRLVHRRERPRDPAGEELGVPEVVPGLQLELTVPVGRGDPDAPVEVLGRPRSAPSSMCGCRG